MKENSTVPLFLCFALRRRDLRGLKKKKKAPPPPPLYIPVPTFQWSIIWSVGQSDGSSIPNVTTCPLVFFLPPSRFSRALGGAFAKAQCGLRLFLSPSLSPPTRPLSSSCRTLRTCGKLPAHAHHPCQAHTAAAVACLPAHFPIIRQFLQSGGVGGWYGGWK